jgi:hypothetical protein
MRKSMRKIYVILTGIIYDIGGGQIYVNNKRDYLERDKWEVYIFSYRYGKSILISDLKNYEKNINRALKYPPDLLSPKDRTLLIESIIKKLGLNNEIKMQDEIIVESNTIPIAMWGELIAKKLNCKHIIYLLYEQFPKSSVSVLQFLDYKHKRKELAGIIPDSLNRLFKGFKTLSDEENFHLKACVGDVVREGITDNRTDNIKLLDFNIGCISRIEKPFIMTMIHDLIMFASKYPQKKILLLIIGDAPYEKIKRAIKNKVKPISNINLIITGAMFPIPKKIFSQMDIFFACSGAARVCAHHGGLTASIDINTHKSIGFLGYDTDKTIYDSSKSPPQQKSIFSVLEDVLIRKKTPQGKEGLKLTKLLDYRSEYEKHMEFIALSSKERKYYQQIPKVPVRGQYLIINMLSKLFGVKVCVVIDSLYYKFKIFMKI